MLGFTVYLENMADYGKNLIFLLCRSIANNYIYKIYFNHIYIFPESKLQFYLI